VTTLNVTGTDSATNKTFLTTKYTYLSHFTVSSFYAAATSNGTMEQSFSFSTNSYQTDFANRTTNVPGGSIKWSILINTDFALPNGLSVDYLLSDVSPSSLSSSLSRVALQCNITSSHSANSTTYYLPLTSSAGPIVCSELTTVAILQVFDIAFIDGTTYSTINHYLKPDNSTSVVMVLQFPGFNSSLYYDPVLQLGVLEGASPLSPTSGNFKLILATVLAGGCAIILVLGTAGGLLFLWFHRRSGINKSFSVNFSRY